MTGIVIVVDDGAACADSGTWDLDHETGRKASDYPILDTTIVTFASKYGNNKTFESYTVSEIRIHSRINRNLRVNEPILACAGRKKSLRK